MKNLAERIDDFIQKTAKRKGWVLQSDPEFLQTVKDGLVKNLKTYGYYLCPCREGWGELSKDRDISCPCKYSNEDIREFGHCYCGLFLSEEAAASGKIPEGIPDRRPDEMYPD